MWTLEILICHRLLCFFFSPSFLSPHPHFLISSIGVRFHPNCLVISAPTDPISPAIPETLSHLSSFRPLPLNYLQVQNLFYSAHLSHSAPNPRTLFLCHLLTSMITAKDIIYSLARRPLQCLITEFLHIVSLRWIRTQTAELPQGSAARLAWWWCTKENGPGCRANCNHPSVPRGSCLALLLHIWINRQRVESMSLTSSFIHLHAFSPQVWHLYIISGSGRIRAAVHAMCWCQVSVHSFPLYSVSVTKLIMRHLVWTLTRMLLWWDPLRAKLLCVSHILSSPGLFTVWHAKIIQL